LSWAPTPKKGGHPVDYFVPNFGQDHEIKTSLKNTENAEKRLNHKIKYVPKNK
jgi:hypothetical protein